MEVAGVYQKSDADVSVGSNTRARYFPNATRDGIFTS